MFQPNFSVSIPNGIDLTGIVNGNNINLQAPLFGSSNIPEGVIAQIRFTLNFGQCIAIEPTSASGSFCINSAFTAYPIGGSATSCDGDLFIGGMITAADGSGATLPDIMVSTIFTILPAAATAAIPTIWST